MQERAIQFEMELDAPIDEVWAAWTTEEGVRSFFSPDCNIELRPGGPYEIFFDAKAKPGHKGGDDMMVLAFQAPKMFSFTWNAPGTFPEVRPHRSHVTIRLEAFGEQKTRLHFREDGYGEGGEWDQRFEYFINAWGKVVLPRLAYRFANGPVDWSEKIELETFQDMVRSI
jgi:uncharacterized protein YndB with AHSA1/START domain